jgi:hypothetical protein
MIERSWEYSLDKYPKSEHAEPMERAMPVKAFKREVSEKIGSGTQTREKKI